MKIKDMMEELKWYIEWRGSEDDEVSFVYPIFGRIPQLLSEVKVGE